MQLIHETAYPVLLDEISPAELKAAHRQVPDVGLWRILLDLRAGVYLNPERSAAGGWQDGMVLRRAPFRLGFSEVAA
jgi:hypothetical protein